MDSQTKICQNCKCSFQIDASDFAFYEKMKVPPPTWCPDCRFVRRLFMRNERALYKRKCDLCGQDKIMVYKQESPFKVFCFSCWWSDKWEGNQYAREYDFSRPFFSQLNELFHEVPRVGIIQQGMIVDSEYANRVSDLKNCYLIFASANNENCLYGASFWDSSDSIDCYNLRKSQRCYECIDCFNCNVLRYSRECNSCSNSSFLLDCRNCESCFGCVNLRNKSYCIFNEQYSKEEYQRKIKQFDLSNVLVVADMEKRMHELSKKYIVPALVEHRSTDISGNWIQECKNTKHAFNCEKVEDGKYLFGIMEAKDVMDYTYWGKSSERIYQVSSVGRQCADVMFCNESWDQLIRAQYSMNCHSSSDLFGCIGLKKKQYCILNKQYTKEEYEALVPKIITHMNEMPYVDKKGRIYKYGEFFPIELSPFAYNETIAQEYFPINKERAGAQGYTWEDVQGKNYSITIQASDIPYSIISVDDSILKEIIACAHAGSCNDQCTTAFKIVPFELSLYREMGIPLPTLCPNCRHYERLRKRTPMKLWHRSCMKEGCKNEFETSYAPERPEIVYCEECYQKEVV